MEDSLPGAARETSSPAASDDRNNKKIPNSNATTKLEERGNAAAIPIIGDSAY